MGYFYFFRQINAQPLNYIKDSFKKAPSNYKLFNYDYIYDKDDICK